MKKIILLIVLLVFARELYSQPAFRYYQSNLVRVVDQNGKDLKNPFGGGLKFPVFTSYDLNFDGKPDLVILDRADDRVLTFINEGGLDTVKYTYRPEYEDLFPDTLSRYIYFLDYNNDGKPDLFTFSNSVGGAVEVFKNISFGNNIMFERYFPDPMNPGGPALISAFYGSDYQTMIPVKSSDIPCFIDADKDGDIDFFTFDDLGGSYLWYFKNFSQEANGNADSLKLDMVDSYWGYFMEADLSNEVFLGRRNPFDWKNYKMLMPDLKRHVGSTFLVNDMDGDGDLDLLVGDIGYPGIRYLINGKKERKPMYDSIIDQDTLYPPSKPVYIHNMPAPFNIDVNNDGVKDFIFSPMDETLIDNKYIDGLNQVWYYKNSGADNNPVLNFVKDNFLQEDMIDLGGSTSPAFFDFDGDGDLDLFVATRGNDIVTKYLADRIVLFENIGTAQNPVFQKKNDDYLNLTTKALKSLTIHFGDIDGDGNKDLVMGEANGHIIYYKNNPVNDSAVFTYVTDYLDSIDVGDYSCPTTADLDHDSKPELIIGSKGRSSGTTLSYFKNISSTGIPKFKLVSDTFGGIVIKGGDHYCSPMIADMDTNGHPDLVLSYNDLDRWIGLVTSKVVIYKDIDLQSEPYKSIDTIFYNQMTNGSVQKYIGRKLKPAFADLDGDSIPDLVFGSERGGLLFYGTNTSYSTQIKVTGKTLLCIGDSAILDAGIGFDSYKWNTGATTQQIIVKSAGTYNCIVTKGQFSYTAYMSIKMHPGTIQAKYTFINNDLTVSFTLLNENIDSVKWSFGDGNYSNVENPVHTYTSSGNYTVCVEIYDNCGASDTLCRTNYFAGVKEDLNCQLSVYPNPAEKMIFIKCNPGMEGQIFILRVTDILGREVINREFTMKQDMSIDIKTFIPGVYPLTITDLKARICKKVVLVKVGQ